jgi:ATP-dependent RNA helicase DDX47/RRP3
LLHVCQHSTHIFFFEKFRFHSNTAAWSDESSKLIHLFLKVVSCWDKHYFNSNLKTKRLGSLNKFKSKARSILIATDVASRGLDIPHVDVVINFDIPTHSKDYIHRVGRTARAGRSGKSVTLVTQYDVELFQRIEHLIGKQLPIYKTEDAEVMLLQERVAEAQRLSKIQIKEMEDKKKSGKRKANDSDDENALDTEESAGIKKRMQGKNKKDYKNQKNNNKKFKNK